MASLVRFYKNKCIEQRRLIDRMKNERAEHKSLRKCAIYACFTTIRYLVRFSNNLVPFASRMVDNLKAENERLSQHIGNSGDPSDCINLNGKRGMMDAYR